MTVYVEDVELNVEEVEEVIAPGPVLQHNETVEVDLTAEEVEEVISPGFRVNHNEMVEVG